MPGSANVPESLAEQINRLLKQTQCRQCDYPGCKPYAEAIAAGEADINQCPPGGDAGIRALAKLLGLAPKPLNAEHGQHLPDSVVIIREAECIGCTKCIQACPVDAIELTTLFDLTGLSREEMMFDKEKLLSVFDQTVAAGTDPVRTRAGQLGRASEIPS